MAAKKVPHIETARVYDASDSSNGVRVLVDRLWPRGVKKDKLKLDHWEKDLAPSDELRRWFGHDPDRWGEFRKRYFAELDAKPETCRELLEVCEKEPVTLLYAAKDEEHNNAVALKQYLTDKVSHCR